MKALTANAIRIVRSRTPILTAMPAQTPPRMLSVQERRSGRSGIPSLGLGEVVTGIAVSCRCLE
jgi:hypothetical protein